MNKENIEKLSKYLTDRGYLNNIEEDKIVEKSRNFIYEFNPSNIENKAKENKKNGYTTHLFLDVKDLKRYINLVPYVLFIVYFSDADILLKQYTNSLKDSFERDIKQFEELKSVYNY